MDWHHQSRQRIQFCNLPSPTLLVPGGLFLPTTGQTIAKPGCIRTAIIPAAISFTMCRDTCRSNLAQIRQLRYITDDVCVENVAGQRPTLRAVSLERLGKMDVRALPDFGRPRVAFWRQFSCQILLAIPRAPYARARRSPWSKPDSHDLLVQGCVCASYRFTSRLLALRRHIHSEHWPGANRRQLQKSSTHYFKRSLAVRDSHRKR